MKDLSWELCKPGAPEALIADVEARLGVRFPDEYRAIVQKCQRGYPVERRRFQVRQDRHTTGSSLGCLLMVDPAVESDSMLPTLANIRIDDQIPDNVIPFGAVGNGDLICFDYRRPVDGGAVPIVYWDHEKDKDESVFSLAPTFAAFLDMLEPPRELP
jgi:cell wall assembly regulator SMI1